MRMPFPVEPSLLLMFMTMLVRSCGRLRHDISRFVGRSGVGDGWNDLKRVVEGEAAKSSIIVELNTFAQDECRCLGSLGVVIGVGA